MATKGMATSQSLPDDLAVEEARPDEVGDVPVEPLHPLEQRARRLARLELGQQVADHVVAEGGVHRRPRVLEGVVGVGLVPVDHPDPLGPVVGADDQVAGQGEVARRRAAPSSTPTDVAVPGQLAVVVAGQHDHVVARHRRRSRRPPR